MIRKVWKRYWIIIVTLFVVSSVSMGFIYNLYQPPPSLPIINPDVVNQALVDPSVSFVRKFHKIPDFKLVNQNGDTITQADYKGKIYVANFFYTTCPTICPVMMHYMKEVQTATLHDDKVKLLSHSVMPAIDTVAQLKRYAEKLGVISGKWDLVTGPKKEIYDLARKAYCVAKSNGNGGPYDLIHTQNIALIDSKKRIRGFYDGTDPDAIEQLIEDIKLLEKIEARNEQ